MRVIGGTARGTKLVAVPGDTTRPILDRVKASLFDILRPSLAEMELMLDLFAGSGGVGIEALSLGVENAVFLDLAEPAIDAIKQNLKKTRFTSRGEVRKTDAFSYLRKTVKIFDFIFVAPPQYEGLWIEALRLVAERPELLSENGKLIVQIDPKEYEVQQLSTLSLYDERKYGNSLLLFFEKSLRQ